MAKRKSTIDERLATVKEYTEAGKPYEQIARERGFSYRQVYVRRKCPKHCQAVRLGSHHAAE